MARDYLQLRDGSERLLDPEGIEFADVEEMRKTTLAAARDVMSGDLRSGLIDLRFRIDVEDGKGAIVHTLRFAEAVRIIPDDK